MRYGAGRENITVLGVANAAGVALDPLIIFAGKNMQSTWYGNKALPNTFYGKSDNGWMDTEIFAIWFNKFADTLKERPLLLMFDGHLTHISIPVIRRACSCDYTWSKMPADKVRLFKALESGQ